jgi:hypothetical protein
MSLNNNSGKYDDIINLPHYISDKRAKMSIYDRAAQFSPFAALTGYDAAIEETARLTDTKIELDESEKAVLNQRLCEALECGEPIRIAYFLPDERKVGGAYVCTMGRLRKIDTIIGSVLFEDGTVIPIEDVVQVLEIENKY